MSILNKFGNEYKLSADGFKNIAPLEAYVYTAMVQLNIHHNVPIPPSYTLEFCDEVIALAWKIVLLCGKLTVPVYRRDDANVIDAAVNIGLLFCKDQPGMSELGEETFSVIMTEMGKIDKEDARPFLNGNTEMVLPLLKLAVYLDYAGANFTSNIGPVGSKKLKQCAVQLVLFTAVIYNLYSGTYATNKETV